MTVITAVQKGDEIAIACDTQTTSGNYNLKYLADYKVNHNKLLTYGNSIVGLSGTVAIKQMFEDLFDTSEPADFTSRQEIFRWMLAQQSKLKSDYFLKPDAGNNKNQVTETNWSSGLIANPYGIFGIGAYREIMEYSKFWAIGSGGSFALGAMEILYEQDLSASEIAEAGALTATKFNPACAPPIYVQTLKKAKAKKKPASKRTASKRAASKSTASKSTASKSTANKSTASKRTTSKGTASKTSASKRTTSKSTTRKRTTKKKA
ncbi:MAG: hypothetical protein AB8B99_18125 [Phormidesmis sp.]